MRIQLVLSPWSLNLIHADMMSGVLLLFALISTLLYQPVFGIWPRPQHLAAGNSTLWYSNDVKLRVYYPPECQESHHSAQARLEGSDKARFNRPHSCVAEQAVFFQFDLLKAGIKAMSFDPWKFYRKGHQYAPSSKETQDKYLKLVKVRFRRDAVTGSGSPEAYHVSGSADGIITISAYTLAGVRHAFQTITQLFYTVDQISFYASSFPIEISDWPRFAHRGLNLDIARNEMTIEDVERTITTMSRCKFNKLHIHATDSQSWPIEIKGLPKLSRKGAYRESSIWSVEDIHDIQSFGQTYGVEVYFEVDMPGHTASIAHAYPNLIAGYDAPLAEYSAFEPPAGQLKLNSSDVNDFLDQLLANLLPELSTSSGLFHLGGDELNTNIYSLDPMVNSTDREVLKPLLQDFYNRALTYVQKGGFTPVFWQEALLEWNLTLPKNSLIQIWRPESSILENVLARGHKALFGAASHWYLDCGFGTFLDPSYRNESVIHAPPYDDWCSPYKSWRQVYSYDPLKNISSDLVHLVEGGEVHLWSELTDSVSLDHKLWPRAAAAAEILWTGSVGEAGVNEDVTRRLADLRERLAMLGIKAEVVQMTWCLMNKGSCAA